MKGLIITALIATSATATEQQADTLTVTERAAEFESGFIHTGSMIYINPALKQFEHEFSITSVTAGYSMEQKSEAVCTYEGKGGDNMFFDAKAYIKCRNATLWGEGYYATGHKRDVKWNETSDAELVYPYFTADAEGGDMKDETYMFSGGYSASNGRIAWGAALGYTAGHHYRDVDPRPRNVTGQLEIKAGLACRMGKRHVIAVGGDMMKYKQTGDIDFMSELGQTKVYHLTGLGTDYMRFRGNGLTTNYDGTRYGVQINAMPADGNGLSGTLHLSRLTIKKILSDMNKLPLNSLWHNSLDAEVCYKKRGTTSWGVSAVIGIYRRHGMESIFGDAASGTYMQIGTLEMYADNACRMGINALVERCYGNVLLSYIPQLGYSHRCQVYAEPVREWSIDNRMMQHCIKAGYKTGIRCYISLQAAWGICSPTACRGIAEDDGNSEGGLMDALLSDFRHASSTRRFYSAKANARYAINSTNALQLSLEYRHDDYVHEASGNTVCINAGVIF